MTESDILPRAPSLSAGHADWIECPTLLWLRFGRALATERARSAPGDARPPTPHSPSETRP